MTNEKHKAIVAYNRTIHIFEKMKNDGTITEKDFAEIEGIIAKKYGLSLSVIYRSNSLTVSSFRGNM